MTPQFTESLNRIAEGARANFRAAVSGARGRGQQAARRVAGTRKPLEALAGVGLKLSAVSHRTTDRVLKQNTQLAVHQLDAVAERLESAATAACLRDLVKKQIKLTPGQFARFGRDARDSLSIVVEGGAEARKVLKSAVSEMRAPAAGKAPARKKAVRKKAAKKAPVKKAAAKRAPRRVKKATPAASAASAS